jgi:hypothetical protein
MRNGADIIAEVTADNRAVLYRCRWSPHHAARVVPDLIQTLSDRNPAIVDEALRSLFTIGTPAIAAASCVAQLIKSQWAITRQVATLTLGSIAHTEPDICIGPITGALDDKKCRHDALRILKSFGTAAMSALPNVTPFWESPDAKTRRLAYITAISIAGDAEVAREIASKARADRSQAVRVAVEKAMQKARPKRSRGLFGAK